MFSCRIVASIFLVALLLIGSAAFARDDLQSPKYTNNPEQPLMAADMGEIPDVTVVPFIDWPTWYGVQQTGMINATFDCLGGFGAYRPINYNVPSWPVASFETPPASQKEYLFLGAFWIGGIVNGDTLVSTGFDGWTSAGVEYHPPNYPKRGSVTQFDYATDYSMRTVFLDTMTEGVEPDYWLGRPHMPLNIEVSSRSHVWESDDYQDFILYDVVVSNIGGQLIEDAFVGIYADADVFVGESYPGYIDDLAGSIKDEGIAYIIDSDGNPFMGAFDPTTSLRKCFAVKLLASSHDMERTNFNWWVNNGDATKDFGPRLKGTPPDPFFDFGTGGLGTPEGDVNKYYVLSHDEWDYDQIYTAHIEESDPHWLYPTQEIAWDLSDGYDARFLLSFGPVDLGPGENMRVVFAMVTGDIHVDPTNGNFLPDFPDDYLANLDLENLIYRADLAGEKAAEMTDPMLPPIGLEIAQQNFETVTVKWDPWCFDNITGQSVYLGQIALSDIPYPGAVPPWLPLDASKITASIGTESEYVFTKLKKGDVYYTDVANRIAGGTGEKCEPIIIDYRNVAPPVVDAATVYYSPECDGGSGCDASPVISWSPPRGVNVDFYNVYRFDDSTALAGKYYPFYDEGEHLSIIDPKESFVVNGITYYFYQMDVYATVPGDAHEFTDGEPLDGAFYIVAAVDDNGCETRFSESVKSYAVANFQKDVLLVTNLQARWAAKDSVRAFYDDVLAGYDYDIYSVTDTAAKYNCYHNLYECMNWQGFTDYKILIIDEDNWSPFFTERYESKSQGVTNYLLAGGKLMYFGGFEGFIAVDRYDAHLYPLDYDFVQRFFGVDNVYYYGLGFYGFPFPCNPHLDTCFAFNQAKSMLPSQPSVYYDQTRNPFSSLLLCTWLPESPPSVATFGVNSRGRTTHVFRSLYPEMSWVEGDPVGVKTLTSEAETYLFGFNMWYMQRASSRQLLDGLFRKLLPDELAKNPSGIAESFMLSQNYPNPFNPSTIITFNLPQASGVKLRVYNILGQQVKELINTDNMAAGVHTVEWHGDNVAGDRVSSGVYFYRLEAGDEVASKTMIMLK